MRIVSIFTIQDLEIPQTWSSSFLSPLSFPSNSFLFPSSEKARMSPALKLGCLWKAEQGWFSPLTLYNILDFSTASHIIKAKSFICVAFLLKQFDAVAVDCLNPLLSSRQINPSVESSLNMSGGQGRCWTFWRICHRMLCVSACPTPVRPRVSTSEDRPMLTGELGSH